MKASIASKDKGCWTCKDRKVRCDKTRPSCKSCLKGGRVCGGYGLRLSWGQHDDRRRHQVTLGPSSSIMKPLHFLNTLNTDASAFYNFQSYGNYRLETQNTIPPPFPILQPYMGVAQDEFALVSYFQVMVVSLFSSAYDGKDHLSKTLLRMAFHRGDLSSLSVYRCILALSSMRLYSSKDSRAKVYYSDALSTLSKSMQFRSGATEYLQHIASSMLLNIYEVFDMHKLSRNWSWYFCGSKTIVKLVYESGVPYSGDEAELLDWVFYHEALSKFSICHFAGRTEAQLSCADDHHLNSKQALSPNREFINGVAGCSSELLQIMTDLFTTVRQSRDLENQGKSYQQLELRLSSIEQRIAAPNDTSAVLVEKLETMAELTRIACLVYLDRVARGNPYWYSRVEKLIGTGLLLLERVGDCERPFPLFVIACEARTDEQRQVILGVLARTLKKRQVGNLDLVNTMIHKAWIHEDLHGSEDLPALLKYDFVLSGCRGLPAFT